MNSQKIEDYKRRLKLTRRQREIMVGLMLGDGHLETQNNGKTYRLKLEHSVKQKEYLQWLCLQFQEWVLTGPQLKSSLSQGKVYDKCWFNTVSHGSFRFYAQQFYKRRVKVVPKMIRKWLSPLAMAIWFMDDGSIKSKQTRSLILNTQGFSKADICILQEALCLKFGVKTTLRQQDDGIQIFVPSDSVDMFVAVIEPFVIPSMKYKLQYVKLTKLPKE